MDPQALSQAQFRDFSSLITERLGIKMPETKMVMLQSRIQRRAHALGMTGPSEYHRRFFADADFCNEELEHLLNLATTNKTEFLREAAHFHHLVDKVLPSLRRREGFPEIRIWCAGCSTGEEAYTIAMFLSEERKKTPFEFTIVATDVSTRALEVAAQGCYAVDHVGPVPPTWVAEYFTEDAHALRPTLRVATSLRKRIIFGHLNFLSQRYGVPGPFHAIYFRNVMIYFDRETQRTVVGRMVPHLKPGGHLYIAHAETLHGLGLPFQQVEASAYRHHCEELSLQKVS